MSEATRTGLVHPTPQSIILACHEAADAINAERARIGLPPLTSDWSLVIRAGVARANREHRNEHA